MKTKFSFGVVIALLALLAFAYIMFMGLIYWKRGELTTPILVTTVFLAIVVLCITAMCMSKATRWRKIGKRGQIIFGALTFLAFLASAYPFTIFMDVVTKQQTISEEITNLLVDGVQLDSVYREYAIKRIDAYKTELERRGTYHPIKVRNLQTLLLPSNLDSMQAQRRDWLKAASSISVWNIRMPINIGMINGEVRRSVDNYINLSTEKGHADENSEAQRPFVFSVQKTELEKVTESFESFHTPSLLSILIALVCFILMLLPYWLTDINPIINTLDDLDASDGKFDNETDSLDKSDIKPVIGKDYI